MTCDSFPILAFKSKCKSPLLAWSIFSKLKSLFYIEFTWHLIYTHKPLFAFKCTFYLYSSTIYSKKKSKYIFLKNNKSYHTYLYIWCLFLPLLFEQRVPPMDENVVSARIVPNDWSYWHQHEQDSYAEDRNRRFGHF